MQRRNFLKIMGSTTIITAATISGCGTIRHTDSAYTPWYKAGLAASDDPRIQALSYAVLAPNPHNRQAWEVDLTIVNEAALYCDLNRRLPNTDPFDRQTTIGLGCFLEILSIASAELGLKIQVDILPEGQSSEKLDNRPITRIYFEHDSQVLRDPLFANILDRRSNKNTYDTSAKVSINDGIKLTETVGNDVSANFTSDADAVTGLRNLTWNALRMELSTPYVMHETIDLMRIGKKEISANPDGLAFGGTKYELLHMIGLMSRESLGNPESIAFKQGLQMSREQLMSSMAFVWIASPGNSREDQLNSGRAWLRINLQSTAMGLGIQPLSQSLQEYKEMRPFNDQIYAALNVQRPGTIQMLGRLGYAPTAIATPRWPIASKIKV